MNLKVPFRMIYCNTPWSWLKETIWCFVVLKAYPPSPEQPVAPVAWDTKMQGIFIDAPWEIEL